MLIRTVFYKGREESSDKMNSVPCGIEEGRDLKQEISGPKV